MGCASEPQLLLSEYGQGRAAVNKLVQHKTNFPEWYRKGLNAEQFQDFRLENIETDFKYNYILS